MSHQFEEVPQTDIDVIIDAVSRGIPLKEIHGISEEQMKALYVLAYGFYNEGRLGEAEKFFHFLCIYDFYCVDFLMGLAAVYQLKELYQKAADLYAVAFAQGESDYRPMLYSGQCHLAMGKSGKAGQCFRMVIKYAPDAKLKESAYAYMAILNQR